MRFESQHTPANEESAIRQLAEAYRKDTSAEVLRSDLSPETHEKVMAMVEQLNVKDELEKATNFGPTMERLLSEENQTYILRTLIENLNEHNQDEVREILGCEQLKHSSIN